MGGLVAGIIDLFHGDPDKTQENQLENLSQYETGEGESLIGPAAKFEQDILSGDPTKLATALAPEISADQQQVQQAAKTNADFGERSGGTTAATAAAQAGERANIFDLAGGLQGSTAGTSLMAGEGLLGQVPSELDSVAQMKTARRGETQTDIENINKGMSEIASRIMSRGMSSGGNDNFSIPEDSGDGGGSEGGNDSGGGGGGMMDMFSGGGGGGGSEGANDLGGIGGGGTMDMFSGGGGGMNA